MRQWENLNVFQRLTRHWDSFHPYNAAQAMLLRGRPDSQLLQRQWQTTIRQLGMEAVRVNGHSFRWESRDGEWTSSLIVPPLGSTFDQHIKTELARPFESGADEQPFRPFVVEQDGSYYAGVVYHHWVADSYSIRKLLEQWFTRVYDPAAASNSPLELVRQGYWQAFGPRTRPWNLLSGSLQMARWGARLRRARRIKRVEYCDFRTHFSLHQAPDGLISAVAAAAKRARVTVHDLFVAAMAQVCNDFVPAREKGRRRDLSLGSIVDLRGGQVQGFGLCLGFTSVFCREDELADPKRLLACVHGQHAQQKASAAAEASMMQMWAGLVLGGVLSQRRLLEFYRKRVALAAGISNVNLTNDWPARYHPEPLSDYIRVSPCGPMMPVVFTPTTLGNRLNFGLTYRESLISADQAGAIAEQFVARLKQFTET